MSGHSQFKNIMYRKGAQDAKKARVFAKLAREITVAAKSGLPEPDKNPRLRLAIQAARAESMPKDNIERAIAKATTVAGGADFVSMRYEGFSSGKVAVIVEALTDNKNRTAGNVRTIFGKRGGAMGENGSVAFNFERIGYIQYPASVASADEMFEAALEAGANRMTCPLLPALWKLNTALRQLLVWIGNQLLKLKLKMLTAPVSFWNLLTLWRMTKTFSMFTTMRILPKMLWLSWPARNNAHLGAGS